MEELKQEESQAKPENVEVKPEEPKSKPKRQVKPKVKAPAQASGRRKRAIARAVLTPGKGIVRINKMLLETYSSEFARQSIREPLALAGDVASKVDIDVLVRGGGWQGQAEAARVAVGAVLAAFDKKLKSVFLGYDRRLLISDIMVKEKRKPNDSKARKSRQKSYR